MACTSCGMPAQGTSCSMCYGDPYHGNDGYYLAYLESQIEPEPDPVQALLGQLYENSLKFSIREMDWYKRRGPTPQKKIYGVIVTGFEPVENSYCEVEIWYEDQTSAKCTGRVCENDITKKLTINAINPHGDYVLLDVL